MKTISLTPQTFDNTIATSSQPVLVDFWAEWCGPCKMIAPVLEELANEQDGRSLIAKLNVDEAPEIAARFGITAIPTLIVFKGGRAVKTLRGAQSKAVLNAALVTAQNN